MNLFGKKKEETKAASVCACNGNVMEVKIDSTAAGCGCGGVTNGNSCSEEAADGIGCIKVLGSGCKSCHALYENVQEAVAAMGLNMGTEYVTDMEKVVSYGVMSTPALVVNEKVVSMGKTLKVADVKKLFHKLGF